MIKWLGRAVEDPNVEETEKEVGYCAVCECELYPFDSSRWLETPWEECIEVCEACFETRPPGYREMQSKE